MVKVKALLAAGLLALTATNPATATPVNPSATTDNGTSATAPRYEVAPLSPRFNISNLDHVAKDMAAEMQKQTPSFTTLVGTRTTLLPDETESSTLESRKLRPGQVALGCHGKCDKLVRTFDPTLPVPTHSCVRDALTALANWRKYCDNAKRYSIGKDGSGIPHLVLCLPSAPTVEVCCAKWVKKDDPKYAVYPPLIKQHSNGEWHSSETKDKIQVIQPGWDEFNYEHERCKIWRPETEDQFTYYMQNLDLYDIEDADKTGRVVGSEPARYNPEGAGYEVTKTNYLAL